jgi:hypothetical protein
MPLAALALLVSALAGWTDSPAHRPLFTPPALPEGVYRTYVSPKPLDELARDLGVQPQSLTASDAFGRTGPYNRWTVARLYGGRRARVARTYRQEPHTGAVVEAWTLVSPYPDAALTRLEPGTLLIVLRLR